MNISKTLNNIIPLLISHAKTSTISHQLSAALIKGSKLISTPCVNTERNMCKRHFCSSLHAEANAIATYYGKNLTFSDKLGWCIKCTQERKRIKKKEVRHYRYPYKSY